jgi:HAE1 family hydrophobic/amphiphilic exporter-1
MVLSTVLNLFFIPVLYVVVKSLLVRLSSRPKKRPDGCDDDAATLEQQHITVNQ